MGIKRKNKMNTKLVAVVVLILDATEAKRSSAPNGVGKIILDGKDFEWNQQEQTYLNKKGEKRDVFKLEEYARPELGDYDEDSGLLELDFRKVLMDVNRKLKDQEKDLNMLWNLSPRYVKYNYHR